MTIDKEFSQLMPALTDDEYSMLERSLLSEGCRDALVVWNDVLIDGHNRYEICQKHGIPYRTIDMDFEDRASAIVWILQTQLARRNLSEMQKAETARQHEDAVKAQAEQRRLANLRQTQEGSTEWKNFSTRENEAKSGRVRNKMGAIAGMSGVTYEHAVAIADHAPKPVADAARRKELSIDAAYSVTKMTPKEQQEIAERIERGETPKDVVKEVRNRPHVAFNSGFSEWYTPANYIDAARAVMGSIDLDPASSDVANEVVQAATYYTAATNGLDKPWSGNVWLNPPYASEAIELFVDKLISELENIQNAIVLVNNATDTVWFQKLTERVSAVCFPRGRVKFYAPDGRIAAPLQGQAVLYFGERVEEFFQAFGQMGWCALPHV